MNENGHLNGGPGGASTPTLDMSRGKDREYLRRAITAGWPINPDDMGWYYQQLRWAVEKSITDGDAREVNACVRTLVTIVGQVQSDQQLAEKYNRIDVGDPTERVEHGGALKIIEGVPEDAV